MLSIALLFPGQGAQRSGMASGLLARSELARSVFHSASSLLGFDLEELCRRGPDVELNRTEFSQPALFVHSIAALKQLEADRPELWGSVTHLAGLSLGEYTAVCAAGAFSFEDGVKLVQARGRAMQAAADVVESGMSSILGLSVEQLNAVCEQATHGGEFVKIANLLCPGNIAISGHMAALERAEKFATEAGAMRAIRLSVAGAFHTELMRPAVQVLQQTLASVPFVSTHTPVISNVDAAPHREPEEIRELLARQVVAPVQWESSLRTMIAAGVTEFIEVGTGKVLAGTLKRVDRKAACENYGDEPKNEGEA